ncbi:MAG TPA: phosphatidylglycerol lysyltransferase domain-containing protein, partial [Thermomicrobiaceae bacterium]|nr:phosphatidylglycerol lysyltransferase domain-containing protein [Thermomicrobiaceae bacterium]
MAIADSPHESASGASKRSRLQMLQPVWSVAVVALVVAFVWQQQRDLIGAYHQLRLADWNWLVLVVACAVLAHGFITQALSTVIARIGHRIPLIPAMMTHVEREMIAAVMPFGGAASFITLVTRFDEYGVTRNDAMLAVMLYSVIGHLSFIAIAIPALILLVVQHNATGSILIGAVVVLLTALVILLVAAALLKGKRLPGALESRLPRFVHEFRDSARSLSIPVRTLLVPFVFSLAADLFGVLSMWAALHAVRVEAGLTTALLAYTAGTLLLLAAPVFQGLGIVEVSVIYLLTRLGVPLPKAIGATILYRFVDVWLPVIFGAGVHARYQRTLRGMPAYLPALWTALSGVMTLVSVLPRTFHVPRAYLHHAHRFGIARGYRVDHTITLVAGFLLLVLAVRLARRQHSAWVAALVLSSILTMVYLSGRVDDIGALVSGTNVVLLLIYRGRFRIRSDIPSLRRGFYLLLVSFSATYVYGVLSLWLANKRQFGREYSLVSSLRIARDIYLGFGTGGVIARSPMGVWILDGMHMLGVLSIVVSAFAILQPIVWRRRVQRVETERARQLIERFGNSSLDRFKYWPDKHQFFAAGGAGVVSYGLSGRMAVVLGDPSARDDTAFDETLDQFIDFCDLNGWQPAFHQTPPARLDAYRQRGFTAVMIGREAIVPLDGFTLTGKSMGDLRSARNRARREGRRVEAIEPPLSDEVIQELREVSEEWLRLAGRRERTFTLGQFEPAYVRESPVLVLRSENGRAEAFVNLIRDGVPGELTFDLMRHRVDAPNGAMDLLILAMIDLGRDRGCSSLSLGMVPFVNTGSAEPKEAGILVDRAIARLARPMGRFFASENLFAYKNKFHPVWEPRYLIVRSVAQLPRATFALTRLSEIDDYRPLRLLSF